jgi:uncharacterized protein (TIGR02145 family)
MANSAADMTFMIHDGSATGTMVYQESHALTSNAQGLVSCVVGNGVVSQGNFANINWGGSAKFLHVMMGSTDLGTQQMLSVPYALHANGVGVRASAIGDTLTIGSTSIIVPGISAANPQSPASNGGLGSQVLVGNTTCVNEYISVSGCGGQISLTYDGRTYDLVEIGGQCWFADNLTTDQYRNGDPIPTGLNNTTWQNTTAGAYAIYNNDPANDVTYGKLYNWYTTVDTRGLCPTGWHVPTDCEWMYLENAIGMSTADQVSTGWVCCRGENIGSKLKTFTGWYAPNSGATNEYQFMGLPNGYALENQNYNMLGNFSFWWTKSELYLNTAYYRTLLYDATGIIRLDYMKNAGMGVRCIKD